MAPNPAPAAWGVVVPVKRLDVAKSRLARYGDEARCALALAFACDVVAAALACPPVDLVLVVTDDVDAAAALAALGARVVADDPDAGLNPALEHGADLLRLAGDGGVATVAADLPALRPEDLAAVLGAVLPGDRGFVADAAGTGTTVLAAAAGAPLAPQFGPDSAVRHRASGAVELTAPASLRRDVDTPEDLAAALRLGVGERTAAAARRLP